MNELNTGDINPNAAEIANLEAQIASIDLSKVDPFDNGKIKQAPVVENKPQQVAETKVETPEAPAIDPIKAELEKVKGQTQGKTPQEKMAFKLKLEAQRAKEMGINIEDVLGFKPTPAEEEIIEDKPLTRKDIEEILKGAKTPDKTVHDYLDTVKDDATKELAQYYLDNTIKPSGNPEQDFQAAMLMVDAVKFKNQAQLQNIKPEAKNYSSGSSFQPNIPKQKPNPSVTGDVEYLLRDAKTRGIDLSDMLK